MMAERKCFMHMVSVVRHFFHKDHQLPKCDRHFLKGLNTTISGFWDDDTPKNLGLSTSRFLMDDDSPKILRSQEITGFPQD
jgi:hypothetical protein